MPLVYYAKDQDLAPGSSYMEDQDPTPGTYKSKDHDLDHKR